MSNKQINEKLRKIQVIKELINKNYTFSEVRDFLGITSKQLTCFINRHKLGFKIPQRHPIILNEDQEQLIIGSLLGDGCISYTNLKTGNCYFSLHHGIKQKEYFYYKVNILNNIIKAKPIQKYIEDKREGWRGSEMIYVRTPANITFSNYRNKWYGGKLGKKSIYFPDILKLKPLGLAIWYMDDGTLSHGCPIIATQSFKKEDLVFLSMFLKNTYNIDTIIRKTNELYIRKRSRDIFFNLIEPFITESMMYKIKRSLNSVNSGNILNKDNPDPSVVNDKEVTTKEQRLTSEESTNNLDTSAEQLFFESELSPGYKNPNRYTPMIVEDIV
jgi:hypothetical protein